MQRKCDDRGIAQIYQLRKSVSKKLLKITPNSVKTLLGVFFYAQIIKTALILLWKVGLYIEAVSTLTNTLILSVISSHFL